jgi:arylsulfatase
MPASCTHCTEQSPLRTGLLKVGLPAAKEGLSEKDPTIAELLKPQGYATGQFGKNHLGDRNEFLPTVHGFDVFFGNLYHLNAEEEPENPDYPKSPNFKAQFGPRGVLKCVATTTDMIDRTPRPSAWSRNPPSVVMISTLWRAAFQVPREEIRCSGR